MAACTFPGVVAVRFKETLPELQLGLAAMEANDTAAMTIFREVVMRCAHTTLERRTASYLAHAPQPAINLQESRKAS
jgi:hypothetical protein